MKHSNASTVIIGTLIVASAAIYVGNWHASLMLWQPTVKQFCHDSDGGLTFDIPGVLFTNKEGWEKRTPDGCFSLEESGSYQRVKKCKGDTCYIQEFSCNDREPVEHKPERCLQCSGGICLTRPDDNGNEGGTCGDGVCTREENIDLFCPACLPGSSPNQCRCIKACEQDCGPKKDEDTEPSCGNNKCERGEASAFIAVGGSGRRGGGEDWYVPSVQTLYELKQGTCTDDCPLECPKLSCPTPEEKKNVRCTLDAEAEYEQGCQVTCPVYHCYPDDDTDDNNGGSTGGDTGWTGPKCGNGMCELGEMGEFTTWYCPEDCKKDRAECRRVSDLIEDTIDSAGACSSDSECALWNDSPFDPWACAPYNTSKTDEIHFLVKTRKVLECPSSDMGVLCDDLKPVCVSGQCEWKEKPRCGDGLCDDGEKGQCEQDCGPVCHTVDCATPPEGCEYTDPKYENGCMVSCGELHCKDRCELMFCPHGCQNGQCLPGPQDCNPYICPNGSIHPRCTDDGIIINYLVHPCQEVVDACAYMDCAHGCKDGECLPPVDCEPGECPPYDCREYICPDGSIQPRCTEDGTLINYPVHPCYGTVDACDFMKCAHGCKDGQCLSPSPIECNGGYKPGESFPHDDGCNTCICQSDGSVGCTEMDCSDQDDEPEVVLCEGKYKLGESYLAADGCNTCTCAGNGVSACTRKACLDPLPGKCTSTSECAAGEICTVELGVCDSLCNPGEVCPAVCAGTCVPKVDHEDEVITNPVPDETLDNVFTDTSLQTLEGLAANALAARNIIGGFPDGSFRGGQSVNRAEAAKFLMISRYITVPDASNNGRFLDVRDGEWYVKYVMAAADYGVIKGYDDGTFKPANTVNTAEFLKMITETFDLPHGLEHGYADVPQNAWFAPYAGIAHKYQLFPGRVSHLSPEKLLSRGEVAIAIYRILEAQ